MKKLITLSILLAGILPFQSSAQQPLSLKQAIDYGLQHFGTVRIAQNQTEIARQQGREAVAGYLPQVTGSGTVDDNIKLQSTLLPAGVFGPEPRRVAFGSKYQTTASAQADQVIYDKSLLIGIKANKPNQQRAELNELQTKEEVIYNIASNYYQVFVVQQQIGLLRDNLDRTQQVLNILKLQRDNGVIQQVDYDRTEVNINNTRSQLTLAENNLNLALNRLKFQMGMPLEQAVTLTDSTVLTRLPNVGPTQFDPKNLTAVRLSDTDIALQRLNLESIKAGYLPRLSAYARYGTLTLGNEFIPSLSKFTGFGSVGLRLSVPIFDGFRRDAQIRRTQLNVQTLEEQQKLNVSSYQLQFNNAQSQIQRSQLSVQNDERTVQLARKVYDITTLQYRQGTKPLTDLINAENSYREAQTNYVNSLINFYQARLDLEQSQGTLTNFFNQL
ncbi:TolC family protein [Nibrella saemangeumensis]|uniref:TolC family protein n=1 Tax=Nibrella saemangeumensis TaxID=1084526 RepID=A0ABP8MZV7_9BACT